MYNSQALKKSLFELQDITYKEFHSKLIPNVNPEIIIGIRTPVLRTFTKQFSKTSDVNDFLNDLPHNYYEENNLHGFLIEQIKDIDLCIEKLDEFLPYVDNWATCDMIVPKIFKKYPEKIHGAAMHWINSSDTYTVRFGIKVLMDNFLDEHFNTQIAETVCKISSGEYYINMMIAWYFATALAKQYESILPFIEQKRLPQWIHNKTIQKACESRRISPKQKNHLKNYKIK